MKAAYHNLDCECGADFKLRLKLLTGGVPSDLTDCAARMQVREHVNADKVIIELSTENGGILINDEEGVVELNISAASTAALKGGIAAPGFPVIGKCVYDLFLTDAEGIVTPLLRGQFNIVAAVTR